MDKEVTGLDVESKREDDLKLLELINDEAIGWFGSRLGRMIWAIENRSGSSPLEIGSMG